LALAALALVVFGAIECPPKGRSKVGMLVRAMRGHHGFSRKTSLNRSWPGIQFVCLNILSKDNEDGSVVLNSILTQEAPWPFPVACFVFFKPLLRQQP